MPKKKKKAGHYIDEAKFCYEYLEFKKKLKKDPNTKWPPYLIECFMKIIDGVGNMPNFHNYTYLDEMKADAIIPILKYGLNFDPKKGFKAFSYYTMIVAQSFMQTIKKEKKQVEKKERFLLHNFSLNSELFLEDGGDSVDSLMKMVEMIDEKNKIKVESKKKGSKGKT